VHTDSGEKSYLDSHILRPEDLKIEMAKALEQIWEAQHPIVRVHRSFSYFCKNTLGQLLEAGESFKGIATPGAPLLTPDRFKRPLRSIIFAVGSEAGWSAREVSLFVEHGFLPIGLGERIVRVELAVNYLLGQSLLFE
jgi:RsmE family RNA methyltransferase